MCVCRGLGSPLTTRDTPHRNPPAPTPLVRPSSPVNAAHGPGQRMRLGDPELGSTELRTQLRVIEPRTHLHAALYFIYVASFGSTQHVPPPLRRA